MRRLHCGIKVLGTAAAALCIFASATTASAMALTERQWPIGKLTFRDTEQIKCGPARKLFLKAHWYDVASWVENSTWERKHKQHDWDPGFQTGFSIAKSGNYYWKTCVRWGRVTNRYSHSTTTLASGRSSSRRRASRRRCRRIGVSTFGSPRATPPPSTRTPSPAKATISSALSCSMGSGPGAPSSSAARSRRLDDRRERPGLLVLDE
jgi:hypothetical protein